jgi:hypothetical protein
MNLPPLLHLTDENEYRDHFQRRYVQMSPLLTFDGIAVRFFDRNFEHAFYFESVRGSGIKSKFSFQRAKRMDWIKAILVDDSVELYRRIMPNGSLRRIALEPNENYSVIIQVEEKIRRANFVTAYVVGGSSAITKMRSNPKW